MIEKKVECQHNALMFNNFNILLHIHSKLISKSTFIFSARNTPIYTYDGLITHLTNGARVMFFFNTTTCQPFSQTRVSDLPVFGGEINFFIAPKSSNDTTGQLIFNHDGYAFDNTNEGNHQIQ